MTSTAGAFSTLTVELTDGIGRLTLNQPDQLNPLGSNTLAEIAVEVLAPITARMSGFMADPAEIDLILGRGAERARAIAEPIVERTKDIMGMIRSR